MSKRIFAATIGVLSVFAGLAASGYAISVSEDFRNPAVSFWFAALGELVMCSMAFAGLGIGIRYLRFAFTGHDTSNDGLIRPILLGMGLFFPSFLLSLPLTLFSANRFWPHDTQSPERALQVSAALGLASAVFFSARMLKKRKARV